MEKYENRIMRILDRIIDIVSDFVPSETESQARERWFGDKVGRSQQKTGEDLLEGAMTVGVSSRALDMMRDGVQDEGLGDYHSVPHQKGQRKLFRIFPIPAERALPVEPPLK